MSCLSFAGLLLFAKTSVLGGALVVVLIFGTLAVLCSFCLKRLKMVHAQASENHKNLSESELRYRNLFDATSEALFIHDPSGRICDVNERACQLFIFDRAEALSLSIGELSASHAAFCQAEALAKIHAAIHSGLQTFDWHARRRDGSLFWVEVSLRASKIADESVVIASLRDITLRREWEQRIAHNHRLEAVSTLVSGVAHELNNILTPMMMATSVLKDKLPAQEDRDLLGLLDSGARRGAAIVSQLITFCSGTTGARIQLHPGELIRDVAFHIRDKKHTDVIVEERIADNIWHIEAEPTQMHQMLSILAANACDAMPDGGTLTLAAANVPPQAIQPSSDRQVVFSVADTGSGIPPEIHNRIFDPFFSTKEVGKGVGLGLSTLYGIVKSNGGHVTFETHQPKGTVFRVYLPACEDNRQLELNV